MSIKKVNVNGTSTDITGVTDTTLSVTGSPADAAAVGEALSPLFSDNALDVTSATLLHFQILSTGAWNAVTTGNSRSSVVPIPAGAQKVKITASANNSYIAFFDTYTAPASGATPDYSDNYTGRIVLNAGESAEYPVESDMHYLYCLRINTAGNNTTPVVTYDAIKTDKTLTLSDIPAESAAVGAEFGLTTRLKPYDGGTLLGNQSANTVCRLVNLTGIEDAPDGVDLETYYGWLFTHRGANNGIQILWYSHANVVYRRFYRNGGFSAWQGVGNAVKQEVNILVIGNSFDQDSYAYLPAILAEAAPDLLFRICILYTGSAELADHVAWFNNDTKYSIYNIWNPTSSKWTRRGGSNSYTLRETLAQYDWDVITTNYTSSDVVSDSDIDSMVGDARDLAKILQANAPKPFILYMNQVMARPEGAYSIDDMYTKGLAAIAALQAGVGMYDYIPIGTALQNARSNAALDALGDGGHLLYSDNTHMQAGIAPLIASYTIAQKILKDVLGVRLPVMGCQWMPTTEAVTEIHAEGGGLTHGDVAGVTADNCYKAQTIAAFAVNKPDAVTDCADI